MAPEKQENSKQVAADILLEKRYDALVAAGTITDDKAQREVLAALEALLARVEAPNTHGLLGKLFGKAPQTHRGLYIWGNVGRGKSMLMDLFFEQAEGISKRRVHFHAFMQEVHKRIHQIRNQSGYAGDPVAELAKKIASENTLLCFDELQATDPADASLLHRFFTGLFEHGAVVVSTSNHPPVSLYTGVVQRERFAKFITLLEGNMQVIALSSASDYRRRQIKSMQKLYFYPLGAEANAFVDGVVSQLDGGNAAAKGSIEVQGRTTRFTLYHHTIGRFSFKELCSTNLGPADYLALADRLDTVILTDIPTLSPEQRNEAKRFVTLIDALYEHKVKLICTAAAAPEALYSDGDGSFEFQRTGSRLAEMQSEKYLQESS